MHQNDRKEIRLQKPATAKRVIIAWGIIVTVLVLICVPLVLVGFLQIQGRITGAPLVGTWVGESGNILQLRPDGTGRSRPNSREFKDTNFHWNATAKEFSVTTEPINLRSSLNRLFSTRPTYRFVIEKMDAVSMVLVEPRSGERTRFSKRAEDPLLEMAK